ncbi:hypothetical protein P7C73_g2421, partial [Tremellales sp. Uapishka_1]
MPSALPQPGGRKGKNNVPSSPTSPTIPTSSLPRLKLNLRASPTPSSRRPNPRPPTNLKRRYQASDGESSGSQSSELTPAEEDDDDDDEDELDEEAFTPRQAKKTGTPTTKDKGKGKAKGRASPVSSNKKSKTRAAKVVAPKVKAPIANGRDRKRNIKLEEVERRRARDEKFGYAEGGFPSMVSVAWRSMRGAVIDFSQTPAQSSRYSQAQAFDSDATSSFGDDESDDGTTLAGYTLGQESDEELAVRLPEAFAGQEIEDLDYGAEPGELGIEDQGLSGWWEEEEEDEMFISHLSGSDIEQLNSQSSAGESVSEECMSDSSLSSSEGEAVDEFGFPIPEASLFPPGPESATDGPLVLMENWDGQFVLVQPRQERSRSRHRSERGSRTNGSVGGSTSFSAGEQMALIVDPEAYDDSDSSSAWSGETEDENHGGDTTDSMAEEDMPVLHSLDGLLDDPMGMGMAIQSIEHIQSIEQIQSMELLAAAPAPAIVVTEPGVDTPALSTTASASASTSSASILPVPTTPGVSVPMMGTFLPTPADSASHAVIDGSKTATKSPFTRKRRSSTKAAASIASSREGRKRSKSLVTDPFSPGFALPRKQRYSSIPGHPRYIAAQALMERESTPSDSEPISLEDMLDAEFLNHEHDDALALNGQFRFDRVPVSTYLNRNFGRTRDDFSSPSGIGAGETLAPGRMLVSPSLNPIKENQDESESRGSSRKERRKMRRMDSGSTGTGGIRPLVI